MKRRWKVEYKNQGDKENRTLVEYLLPDGEAEICTIWRHPMGTHRAVIEHVVQCLEGFPRNLSSCYAEPMKAGDGIKSRDVNLGKVESNA